jgi:uncharacterized protein (DUF4415 family)
MRKEYDFSKAKRAKDVPHLKKLQSEASGKTRITIYLDNEIIERFKALSEKTGKGYQTLINEALAAHLAEDQKPVTADQVRRILREELSGNNLP